MIRPSAQGLLYLVKGLLHVHRNIQSGNPFFFVDSKDKEKRRQLQRKQGHAWVFNATAPSFGADASGMEPRFAQHSRIRHLCSSNHCITRALRRREQSGLLHLQLPRVHACGALFNRTVTRTSSFPRLCAGDVFWAAINHKQPDDRLYRRAVSIISDLAGRKHRGEALFGICADNVACSGRCQKFGRRTESTPWPPERHKTVREAIAADTLRSTASQTI